MDIRAFFGSSKQKKEIPKKNVVIEKKGSAKKAKKREAAASPAKKKKRKKPVVLLDSSDEVEEIEEVEVDTKQLEKERLLKEKKTRERLAQVEAEKKKEAAKLKASAAKRKAAADKKAEAKAAKPPAAKKSRSSARGSSAYGAYLSRPEVANLDAVPPPIGKPGCLAGKVFLITGVLDTMDRDTCSQCIIDHGGAIAKSVTKKLTHAVIGVDAGPSKLKKLAEREDVEELNEQELRHMIETLPAGKVDPKEAEKLAKKRKLQEEGAPLDAKVAKAMREQVESGADTMEADELWTVKYAPKTSKLLIDNVGARAKLEKWIKQWKPPAPDVPGAKKIKKKAAAKRAVLVSGVPGIGKTSAVKLYAQEAGYEVVEFNASDTRGQKAMREAGLMEMGSNRSLNEFWQMTRRTEHGDESVAQEKKTLILMDEVDGMGAGDRGGGAVLIKIIGNARVPIICVCNDRSKSSVKTLAGHCLDVRFQKPNPATVANRLKAICEWEGFTSIHFPTLQNLCASVNNDIRQCLNLLQMLRRSTTEIRASDDVSSIQNTMASSRNIKLDMFTAAPMLFRPAKLQDKLETFFVDSSMMPLFAFDIWPQAIRPQAGQMEQLARMSAAAEWVSFGDMVSTPLMRDQQWGLLPVLGVVSCAAPAWEAGGANRGRLQFPSWLAKTSNAKKQRRLLGDIQLHMSKSTGAANPNEVRMQYLPHMVDKLTKPLLERGKEGIPEVIAVMDEYGITKEDWDSMLEILGKTKEVMDAKEGGIATQVKSAFTRAYNKQHQAVKKSGKRKKSEDAEAMPDADDEGEQDEEDDADPLNDPLIKQKPAKKRRVSSKKKK